jgi:hypothetical protein
MNNGHNGKHAWPATVEVDGSPYFSSRMTDAPEVGSDAPDLKAASSTAADDADLPPAEPGQRNHLRRNALIFCIVMLTLICAGLALYANYGGSRRVNYRVAEKTARKPGGQAQGATGIETQTTDQMTADAINQAKEELRKSGAIPESPVTPSASPSAGNHQSTAGPIFTPYVIPDAPPVSSAEAAKRTSERGAGELLDPAGGDAAGRRGATASGAQRAQTSHNSAQAAAHSIYAGADAEARSEKPRAFAESARNPQFAATPVTLPGFGAMLPVRTLGAVYTLRTGSLVRLEATREVTGDGWRIKRGTILVAELRGSEYDRAFLTLTGFIDPATNRFVRLGGDVLGADGAPGLKGKRRQINSRWSRVFSRAATGAVALGQAALSRGATTIVVPGGFGGVGSEMGLSNETLSRREFVEIPASAVGYVMITDLPKETRGVDAEPDKRNDGDFLADEELAELLSSGDQAQIKAALPRMQLEMRKLALAVLGERDK